jgi:hypothetical protein
MLRLIARRWAKIKYIFSQEVEAASNELNAKLAASLSAEKRALAARINKDADEIEQSIKDTDEKLEKGFWECENGHESDSMPNVRPAKDRVANLCVVNVNGKECGAEVNIVRRSDMTGQEKYESDKERGEAQKIADSKRQQAKAEEENADNSERTGKYLQGLAQNNRTLAEKIRSL